MQHNHEQGQGKVSRGTTGLIVVLVAVLILVIWLPPYRWFFLIMTPDVILEANPRRVGVTVPFADDRR